MLFHYVWIENHTVKNRTTIWLMTMKANCPTSVIYGPQLFVLCNWLQTLWIFVCVSVCVYYIFEKILNIYQERHGPHSQQQIVCQAVYTSDVSLDVSWRWGWHQVDSENCQRNWISIWTFIFSVQVKNVKLLWFVCRARWSWTTPVIYLFIFK